MYGSTPTLYPSCPEPSPLAMRVAAYMQKTRIQLADSARCVFIAFEDVASKDRDPRPTTGPSTELPRRAYTVAGKKRKGLTFAPDRAIHRILLQRLRCGPEESREPLRAPPPYPSNILRRPLCACSPLCPGTQVRGVLQARDAPAPLVFSRSVLSISSSLEANTGERNSGPSPC